MDRIKDFIKENTVYIAPVLISVVICTVAFYYGLMNDRAIAADVSVDASVADLYPDDTDRTKDEGSEFHDNDTDNKGENSNKKTKTEDSDKDNMGSRILVCVPYAGMNLRSQPGSDPADNIATLVTGDIVSWDGKGEVAEGSMYYMVKLDDGTEGYALGECLVPVHYEYNDSDLDIVETDNALYTYEMMTEDIDKLCKEYGESLSFEKYGKSADNRDLYCLYLGNRSAKYSIFAQGSIHGREYMNTQLLMRMIEYYCHEMDSGSINGRTYRELLDDVCICVVPMSNPDGVVIAQSGVYGINDPKLKKIPADCYETDVDYMISDIDMYGDLFWVDHYKEKGFDIEKYTSEKIDYDDYLKQWKSNARGVDLNNNFDGNWEGVDVKQHPSYGSYKGERVLSEPESKALADLAMMHDYDMYLSYHSKGDIIYYDTDGNTPGVSEGSLNLAKLAAGQLKYLPVSNKTASNVNQGGFGDWTQLSLKKPSITIESGRHRCPLKIEEFKPMWLRHRELWAVLMDSLISQ